MTRDEALKEMKTITGPFHKEMFRDVNGKWSWYSYKGWVGEFDTQGECEDNICTHCGD